MDGLSFLETTARKPGLEILIAFLQQLILDINELGGLLVFKVLLTYPYMSNYANDWFPPEAILNMAKRVVAIARVTIQCDCPRPRRT